MKRVRRLLIFDVGDSYQQVFHIAGMLLVCPTGTTSVGLVLGKN